MFTLTPTTSREDVLLFLAKSSSYGNLGLFIGAGFSKAVLNDGTDIALSWGELLGKAAQKMGLDYHAMEKVGISYPELASTLCSSYAKTHALSYVGALQHLKREIASLTSWYPTPEQRETYSGHLAALRPSWIITTNYDLIIESLLTGKSVALGPNDALSSGEGVVPVFHLHGIRTNPDDIIISQEDYVALFRPNQYRQIKLALTIKESTTVLVGYGLGDVNVLTAIDWSRNVFRSETENYPNGVIQILRKANPETAPYLDKNGITILETADLKDFFTEAAGVCDLERGRQKTERDTLEKVSAELSAAGDATVKQFIEDPVYRARILTALSKFSVHLSSGFISLLNKCIDETWARSAPNGAFEGYNENLIIILDILIAFPLKSFPPAVFQAAAYGLDRVGYYVGNESGKSWSAANTWTSRKDSLNAEIVKELKDVSEQYSYSHLKALLSTIPS